jgi:hypothetical protein
MTFKLRGKVVNNSRPLNDRPAIKNMQEITSSSKALNPLLRKLLIQGMPHPQEEPVRQIIRDTIKGWNYDVSVGSKVFWQDAIGNLYFDNRTDKAKQTTMFSCHMDTVHGNPSVLTLYMTTDKTPDHEAGHVYGATKKPYYDTYDSSDPTKEVNAKQVLQDAKIYNYDGELVPDVKSACGKVKMVIYSTPYNKPREDTGIWFWAKHKASVVIPSVLGADDKVGCYMLLRMIDAKVPGLYVFHVGEERGCIGSKNLLQNNAEVLKGLKSCIAFDRMDYTDVIALQRNGRCSSIQYSNELAKQLNRFMPPFSQYVGNIQGVFTDSAIYYETIPECINISVGYFRQHTSEEHFDNVWLETHLIPAVIGVPWDTLEIHRDPAPVKAKTYDNSSYYRAYGHHSDNDSFVSNKIKATEVNGNTPLWKCPIWVPDDGIIVGIGRDAMLRIIEAHYDIRVRSVKEQAQEMYKMVIALDDVATNYAGLRTWLAANDIEPKLTDANDCSGDPNGDDLKGVPNDFKELVDAIQEHNQDYSVGAACCSKCHRENERCICIPVRSDFSSDAEFDYEMNLFNNKAPIERMVRPERNNFPEEASFQAKLGEYQVQLKAEADRLLLVPKKKSIEELLADPEIQARLEH